MFTTRNVRMTVATLFVCLAAVASAQGDERARELLAGVMTSAQPEMRTMRQTSTTTFGSEVMSETLYVVDFVNRRAVITSTLRGTMTSVTRHADGDTRMFIDGEEIDMSTLPGITDPFEWIFDVDQLDVDFDDATYDGFVTYGDVLAGEQVTTSAMLGMFGLPAGTTMSYVFGENGEVLGASSVTAGVTTIMIFDSPGAGWSTIDGATITMYTFDGTTATLAGTFTWDPAIIDEPLDESLFD